MSNLIVPFLKLYPEAKEPTKGYINDACYDLYCCLDTTIPARGYARVTCGVAMCIPPGYEAQLRGRSSFAIKGILCHFGTIDSGYLGEIGPILFNLTDESFSVRVGDKVCQIAIRLVNLPSVPGIYFQELSREEFAKISTSRGAGGFGSSGR